jgi:methionine-gamma-lyase
VPVRRDRSKDARKTSIEGRALHRESLMMSYGYDPRLSEGAIKCPIFQTSTFVFETAEEGKAFFEVAYGLREQGTEEATGLIYSRLNNPDLEVLEDRLTLWDRAEACAVFASGMAAIATTLLAYARPGDALVFSSPLYGGSDHLLKHFFTQLGVAPIGFSAGLPLERFEADLIKAVGDRPVAAILVETPANPTNALVDIRAIAGLAHRLGRDGRRPMVVVDNTFLGPMWQQPLAHGADLVVYSATKFIGGHSDLIAGAVLGSRDALAPVRGLRTFLGTMAGPWTGWLLLRSLETLKMRMTASMKNARYVADFLRDHPRVRGVYYLGHIEADNPMYETYRRQCTSPGSLIAFEVEGGEAGAFRFLNALGLVKLAVSLGGTESLAEHPFSMTHADVAPEVKARLGITPGLVRFSVGVEHYEDILADVGQALKRV